MSYLPIQLSKVNGTPVILNVNTITGMTQQRDGAKTHRTVVCTSDGQEWPVYETIDQIREAIDEARGVKSDTPAAPMAIETKKGPKK